MDSKHKKTLKRKAFTEVLGGMTALCGLFLPYARDLSFFQSLNGLAHGYFAPALTLAIAFTSLLYTLGLEQVPCAMSLVLLFVCGSFPCYACWKNGFGAVLAQLQLGAWVLVAGLSLMALPPLFPDGEENAPPTA